MQSDRLHNKKYLNWIKTSLSLLYLKQGVTEYSDATATDFHKAVSERVKIKSARAASIKCSSCTPKNALRTTSKETKEKTWRMNCRENVCNIWLEELLPYHEHLPCPHIAWENSDPLLWPSDSWELAKLFQPFGCKEHKSAKDSDATALLSMMKDCKFFNKEVSNLGMIEDIKEARNKCMHSNDMEIDDADMNTSLTHFASFLQMPCFKKFQTCCDAAEKIEQLRDHPLDLSLNKELELKALNNKINEVEIEMGRITEDTKHLRDDISSLYTAQESTSDDFRKVNKRLGEIEVRLKEVTDSGVVAKVKCRIKELERGPEESERQIEDRNAVKLKKLGSDLKKLDHAMQVMGMPGRLLATYPLLPSFKYCERLDCYTDSVDHVDDKVPPPHPPPRKKADVFILSDFEEVDHRATNTPARYLKGTLKELVDYLTEGLITDISKVRVLYRWITCQPVDRLELKKEPQQTQVQFQLWRIKHKKGNYAQLVSLLCRHASIPCVIIHGMLKGSTYEVGDTLDEDKHYGEWNAVLVNKHWRFLNAYWGTCAEGASPKAGSGVDMTGKLYYNCDENYFLTDPDQNAATHFPKSPKWQLKDTPVSLDEFESMTFVKDRYFNLNMKTLSHQKCVINSDSGQVEIKFKVPKNIALDIDFQYLLFKLEDGKENRVDRYVFMHRTSNLENLTVKIRYPTYGTLRFELVGKDTMIADDGYDYDWIAIYKIFFGHGLDKCTPYPPMPATGWGPARAAEQAGIVPLSHFTGEITMDDMGKAEVRFGAANKKRIGEMVYGAMVYTGGEKMEELSDLVVHRVEDGDVIFNVMTPDSGEYVLKLFIRGENEGEMGREFCSYFLLSKQKEKNTRFPKDFRESLGPKNPAFTNSGLKPSRPQGYLKTDQGDYKLSFNRTNSIQLSVNLSGENLKPSEAPRLISQTESGKTVTYNLRMPEDGLYGVKLQGTTEEGAVHEPLYQYVIDYRKLKKRAKNGLSIKQEAEAFDEKETGQASDIPVDNALDTPVDNAPDKPVDNAPNNRTVQFEDKTVDSKDAESELDGSSQAGASAGDGSAGGGGGTDAGGSDMSAAAAAAAEALSKANRGLTDREIQALLMSAEGLPKGAQIRVAFPDGDSELSLSDTNSTTSDVDAEETAMEVLRRRMRMAIEEWNLDELRTVLRTMKSSNLASLNGDIKEAETHVDLMRLKRDLIVAIRDKDSNKLKSAIKKVKKAGKADMFEREMAIAQHLLSRLKKLQKLLHAVLALDQATIHEIRSYATPPPIVQTVMMATLLLLGYWKEETRKWKAIQTLLGKTGRESIKRLISEFKIETCPLEVAVGARDYLSEYSIDQVRLVSAGCATFFIWVNGVVEELEKRAGEDIFDNIRPRTSRSAKKNRIREMTFLQDLEAGSGRNTAS